MAHAPRKPLSMAAGCFMRILSVPRDEQTACPPGQGRDSNEPPPGRPEGKQQTGGKWTTRGKQRVCESRRALGPKQARAARRSTKHEEGAVRRRRDELTTDVPGGSHGPAA